MRPANFTKRRLLIPFVAAFIFCFLLTTSSRAGKNSYYFPIKNPYVATVVGTPPKIKVRLPEEIPVRDFELDVFSDRKIPDVFWYQGGHRFSVAYQEDKAPLIFVIAGTGAGYNSRKMRVLQGIFYRAGFHVISLSSPTFPNFIVTASTQKVPGPVTHDARDLYRVMQIAYNQVRDDIAVSEFYLTGYSLGATQAAFVSYLDERMKKFNFKKVLLINPAVNLYNSVQILDNLLEENIPGGMDKLNKFLDDLMEDLARLYRDEDEVNFNDDAFLYRIYQHQKMRGQKVNLWRVKALIGMAFRLSLTNMVFTADVMSRAGYVVPKNIELSSTDSLKLYFLTNNRLGFSDYLDGFLYPHFRGQKAGLTKQKFIQDMSLKRIRSYLAESKKIGVITNADDFILAPGEVEFLESTFGGRAKILPRGGHCGNIDHRQNAKYMIGFLNRKALKRF